jgi:hypothetical protein
MHAPIPNGLDTTRSKHAHAPSLMYNHTGLVVSLFNVVRRSVKPVVSMLVDRLADRITGQDRTGQGGISLTLSYSGYDTEVACSRVWSGLVLSCLLMCSELDWTGLMTIMRWWAGLPWYERRSRWMLARLCGADAGEALGRLVLGERRTEKQWNNIKIH